MHASLEQLLCLRESAEPELAPEAPEVARHVRGCSSCSEELARLQMVQARLQSLPQMRPPASSWAVIQARVQGAEAFSGGRTLVGDGVMSTAAPAQVLPLPVAAPQMAGAREAAWLHRASAVGLAAIVALLAVIALRIEAPSAPPAVAALDQNQRDGVPFSATPPALTGVIRAVVPVSSDQLKLQERSRRLEQLLHATHRPAVVNVRAASTIEALESELAQLDYHLTMGAQPLSADEQLGMWQQRVQLLDTLLDVRANNGVRQTAF